MPIYIYSIEKTATNKAYQRVTTDVSSGSSVYSIKRKEIVDAIENRYGVDFANYSDSIRKASLLYRFLLKNDVISIGSKSYKINIEDKLHIIMSGFLYTLRNDIMHRTSISITKSSKSTLGTYAFDYYAFLLLYYLLMILIIDK